jgi:DNA mismatch endonuclease (patch repair protein)
MDHVGPEARSAMMGRIKGADTRPEITVRKILHRLGFRFRLHKSDLPGKPDIVLPRWRVIVFVHGCFWHRHPGCGRASTPSTRVAFWRKKFAANMARDVAVQEMLRDLGWRVCVVWQCELTRLDQVGMRLATFIRGQR